MTAITEISRTVAPAAPGIAAVLGAVVRRLRQLARAAKHRRDAAILAGLDDRMLADIGLTRGDLRDAFARPLWHDPTAVLVSRVCERRANRRRPGLKPRATIAPSIVPETNAALAGATRRGF